MKDIAKSVLNLFISKILIIAIPIIVFIIAIAIAMSVGGGGSSSSAKDNESGNMSSSGTSLCDDFIAGWEDSTAWQYLNGKTSYSDYLSRVITEDKEYFICYTDGFGDRNYGYGVCHWTGSYWNNVELYDEKAGIDITEDKYNNIGTSKIEVDKVLAVYQGEIEACRESIKSDISKEGITLSESQIDALTAVKYQYGNIGNFCEMYKKYGNTEELKNNAEAIGATYSHYFVEVKPGGENARNRGEANWKLFHEGKYIVQDGIELDPSSYSESSESKSDSETKTDSAIRNKIISLANSKIGCRYVLGRKGPNEFDCSGFVYWIYQQNGITVPGSSDDYSSYKGSKKEMDIKDAKPGDILHIFKYERTSDYGHVAIYLNENTTIEAMGSAYGVCNGKVSGRFKRIFNFIDK